MREDDPTAGWLARERRLREVRWRVGELRASLVAIGHPEHWSGLAQRASAAASAELVASLDRAGLEIDEAMRRCRSEASAEIARVG